MSTYMIFNTLKARMYKYFHNSLLVMLRNTLRTHNVTFVYSIQYFNFYILYVNVYPHVRYLYACNP